MSALQTVIDMFRSGGLQVTTLARDHAGHQNGPLLYRTVIQPDANIITWVNPRVLDNEAWQEHLQKLESHIQAIRAIRKQFNSVWAALSLIFVAISLILPTPQDIFYWILKIFITAGAIYGLQLLLRFLLRWYIRRQLKRYIPGW